MVNAAAAKQSLFTVDKQPLVGPGDFPDSEGDFNRILSCTDFRSVEIWIFGGPKLCVRNSQSYLCALTADPIHLSFHGNGALDPDDGGVDAHSADLHAFGQNPVTHIQPDRAVNACAGVPTRIRELRIISHDRQNVLLPVFKSLQFYKKVGITVGMEAQFLTVQGYSGVLVHALKLDKHSLSRPLT